MLYILLIIIAIGVLLASEGGRELLKYLIILLIIGGLAYLGFWIVIIVMGLLSDEGIRDMIFNVISVIFSLVVFGAGIGYVVHKISKAHKELKNGDYSIRAMGRGIKNRFIKKWEKGWVNKALIIFLILAFLFIILSWLYSFIVYD